MARPKTTHALKMIDKVKVNFAVFGEINVESDTDQVNRFLLFGARY